MLKSAPEAHTNDPKSKLVGRGLAVMTPGNKTMSRTTSQTLSALQAELGDLRAAARPRADSERVVAMERFPVRWTRSRRR
jgi:hypothetical protein